GGDIYRQVNAEGSFLPFTCPQISSGGLGAECPHQSTAATSDSAGRHERNAAAAAPLNRRKPDRAGAASCASDHGSVTSPHRRLVRHGFGAKAHPPCQAG